MAAVYLAGSELLWKLKAILLVSATSTF